MYSSHLVTQLSLFLRLAATARHEATDITTSALEASGHAACGGACCVADGAAVGSLLLLDFVRRV
jgi:hypothetical protein